jgi:hypothetical protein
MLSSGDQRHLVMTSAIQWWWPVLSSGDQCYLVEAATAAAILTSHKWLWIPSRQDLGQKVTLCKLDKDCYYPENTLKCKIFCRSTISKQNFEVKALLHKHKVWNALMLFSLVQMTEVWNPLPGWLTGSDPISEVIRNNQQGQVSSSG